MGVFGLQSLKIENYKCFGGQPQGFEEVRSINLIVGRNNVGKSTLVDVVRFGIEGFGSIPRVLYHGGKVPTLIAIAPLAESTLQSVYPSGSSGGVVRMNFWEYGKQFVGAPIGIALSAEGDNRSIIPPTPSGLISPEGEHKAQEFARALTNAIGSPVIPGKKFKRLFAERNISPETESEVMGIQGDGSGVANAINQFLNHGKFSRDNYQHLLLGELNAILSPDSLFTSIAAKKAASGNLWEIYLEERQKGLVQLSHTGSGFKTILLILAYLHLFPRIEGASPSSYVYAFEEPENNLHPAIQRRLLSYLRKYATERDVKIFITTHSSVAIDMFSRDGEAQILHVTHDGQSANSRYCSRLC